MRTLWQKTAYNAGSYQVNWDGLDDSGQPVGAGTYKIKVIAHNVKYVWEGVVGNTSASWTNNIWHSLTTMQDFCVAPSGESYAALGYNEVTSQLVYNPVGTVQAPRRVYATDLFDAFSFVRADNAYLYAVTNNSGWDKLQSSFVMRFKQSDKSEAPWSNGQKAVYDLHQRSGVLSLRQSPTNTLQQRAAWLTNRITGLAVTGSYIAVARKAQNAVQFYAVATGASLGTLAVSSPGQIAFATTGDLWVISGGQVKRFAVTGGTSFAEKLTLPGITQAIALDAHPSQDLLLVADASSQQLKAYTAAGALSWTYGQAGGYPVNGPDVTNDKFWFQVQDPLARDAADRDAYGDPFTFVKWQPDGTFWVLDTGNLRAMHFGATRNYLEQIMYLPDRLQLAGDQNDATRVFSEHLEFKVSTAPLQPGDQSLLAKPTWKLVKNWGAGVDIIRYGYLVNVTTHANGHTYAQVHDNNADNQGYKSSKTQLVELPSAGPLRFTGILLEEYGNGGFSYEQMPNGSLRLVRTNVDQPLSDYVSNTATGKAQLVCEQRALTGYDSNFNPQYGPVQVAWTVLSTLWRGNDPFPSKPMGARIRVPQTENGNYVTYQAIKRTTSGAFHLGTIAPGASDWSARFHPGQAASLPTGRGTYPEIDAYGGWDGATVYADKKDIVALYNGQNNTASNTFFHFTQDGLLVNEFGTPATQAFFSDSDYSPPGLAGNNVDMYMVRPSANVLHVYTVDEAAHAGLHRWRVQGTNTIRELTGSGPLGSAIQVALAGVVAAPLPVELTTFGAARSNATVTCKWETASERNSDYFVVERSDDGHTYTAIGKVPSAGTTTQTHTYTYLDARPQPGLTYYRLRLVDQDGTESFSPVATVAALAASDQPSASVAPNPGTDVFELFTPSSPLLEANIYDILGKHLRKLLPPADKSQSLRFDLTAYPAGVYMVHVQMASGSTTVKVIKSN